MLELLPDFLPLLPFLLVSLEPVCEEPDPWLPCATPMVVNRMAAQRNASSQCACLRIIEKSPFADKLLVEDHTVSAVAMPCRNGCVGMVEAPRVVILWELSANCYLLIVSFRSGAPASGTFFFIF